MTFSDRSVPNRKKKATNKDKCYNCHKSVYFKKGYFLPDKKLNRITQKSCREEL